MSFRFFAQYAVITLCVVPLLFLTGCGNCGLDTLSDYEKVFGIVGDVDPIPPKNFNVFIDASASMYGYTAKDSKFHDIINSVISRIPQDSSIQLYGFGLDSVKLQGDLRKMLHTVSDRRFYTQGHTDLCKPFEMHIQDDPHSVNLIFTDMVQSTKYSEQDMVSFARILKKYLGENGFLSLMAIQADYHGTYYVEKVPGKLTVPEGSNRPLYCLAFGNRKYSQFIEDKIGILFPNTFEFGTTTPNKLRCTDNIDYKNDPPTMIHEKNRMDIPVSSFNLKKGYTEALKFTLSGYDEKYGNVLDYSIAYKSKADSSFQVLDGKTGNVLADTFPDNDKVSFLIPFSNKNTGCYLIRLTFRKTLPRWISEFSTDDDTKFDNMDKTYKLEAWMNFIMNNFEDYKYLATTQYYIELMRR